MCQCLLMFASVAADLLYEATTHESEMHPEVGMFGILFALMDSAFSAHPSPKCVREELIPTDTSCRLQVRLLSQVLRAQSTTR